jgi:hypothetical protein
MLLSALKSLPSVEMIGKPTVAALARPFTTEADALAAIGLVAPGRSLKLENVGFESLPESDPLTDPPPQEAASIRHPTNAAYIPNLVFMMSSPFHQ